MGGVGEWVSRWMVDCVRGSGCFDVFRTFFCFLAPWFHRSLSTSATTAVYVIRCTAAIHGGWVHRFVGVTVVLLSAALL